jgi:hypothetical protein
MVYKLKEGFKQVNSETKVVLHNLDRLIESAALVVVAVTAYLMVRGNIDPAHLTGFSRFCILASCVVIALRGAWESLRFLANK